MFFFLKKKYNYYTSIFYFVRDLKFIVIQYTVFTIYSTVYCILYTQLYNITI